MPKRIRQGQLFDARARTSLHITMEQVAAERRNPVAAGPTRVLPMR